MKVMQLLPSLDDGGVERSTVEMARFLCARGVPNWVVADDGPLKAALQDAGTGHVALRVGRKSPAAMLLNVRRLARLIDEVGIDVLHARSRLPAWVGWLAARRTRRAPAFVTTVHGTYGHRGRLKRAYNAIMTRGPVVIANSAFIADHLRSVYGIEKQRIVVAPRGIDPDAFDPARVAPECRQRLRDSLDAARIPLLVLVARIGRDKGHARLIDALSTLRDLPWRMVFVGGGDASKLGQELQRKAAAHGLAERIIFAGSRRDIPEILSATDLAFSVADTKPEAFGRAVIEAGAMRVPVIATAHGGSLETVVPGKTGWLVPPGDGEALAQAIRDALSDPDRTAAMGVAARCNVLNHFTLEQTLEREFAVYRELHAGRAS